MELGSVPSDIILDVLSPDRFPEWHDDTTPGDDLNNWKLICNRWKGILDEGVVIGDDQTASPYHSCSPSKANSHILTPIRRATLGSIRDNKYTLRYAIRYGLDEVVEKLLAAGFDVNEDLEPTRGVKGLAEAASYGHISTVRLLLKNGANIWLKNGDGHGGNILGLREATKGGYREIARLLIAHAKQSLKDGESDISGIKYSSDLLELAAGSDNSSASLVQYFFDLYARIDRPVNMFSLLDVAIASGNEEAVNLILGRRPSLLWERNGNSLPILRRAVSADNELLLRLLIRKGAPIDETSPDQKTALVVAVESDLPVMVETLLDAGADASVKDPSNQSILAIAAQRGYAETVEVLLERGGNTLRNDIASIKECLVQASRHGHSDTVAAFMDSSLGPLLRHFNL